MSNDNQSGHRRRVAVSAALALATLACSARGAAAQDRWLVLASDVGDDASGGTEARSVAVQLARDLRPSGASIVDPVRARDLYEQRGSSAPVMFSHSDLDALARDTQMALYHVASGLPARARRDVERALTRANRVLESLNRESLAAQQLLDACLFLVRAHMQGGRRGAAREQALECRRLVPDIEPDGTTHPPDVIGLLAEAEAHLRINQPGALRVESTPGGCPVYVNGRRLGTAPLELSQLGPGEYRVQAECVEGSPGRVHRVHIGSTRVTVRIDTALDEAIRTGSLLALRYGSAQAETARGAEHAVEVARIVGATHVLWVSAPSQQGRPAGAQLQLLAVDDRVLVGRASAVLEAGRVVELPALQSALLASGGDAPSAPDLTPSPPAVVGPQGPVPGVNANRKPPPAEEPLLAAPTDASDLGAVEWLSPTLAIAGGATLLVGWGLWTAQHLAEERHAERVREGGDYRETLREVDGSELTAVWVGVAGAVVTTVTLPMLDLPVERSATWSIGLGALGVGALGAGVTLSALGASCDSFDATPRGRCTDTMANSRLGLMLLATSAPLLSLPIAYLLSDDPSGELAVAVTPRGGDGAVLTVGGVL